MPAESKILERVFINFISGRFYLHHAHARTNTYTHEHTHVYTQLHMNIHVYSYIHTHIDVTTERIYMSK